MTYELKKSVFLGRFGEKHRKCPIITPLNGKKHLHFLLAKYAVKLLSMMAKCWRKMAKCRQNAVKLPSVTAKCRQRWQNAIIARGY